MQKAFKRIFHDKKYCLKLFNFVLKKMNIYLSSLTFKNLFAVKCNLKKSNVWTTPLKRSLREISVLSRVFSENRIYIFLLLTEFFESDCWLISGWQSSQKTSIPLLKFWKKFYILENVHSFQSCRSSLTLLSKEYQAVLILEIFSSYES